jgi:hypothetical protein
MDNAKEMGIEVFSGFNTTNADDLLKGLMRMFTTINHATTDGTGDHKDMQYVVAILNTSEFVVATKPELADRLQVIMNACLDKMYIEYKRYSTLNSWMIHTLARHGRLKL